MGNDFLVRNYEGLMETKNNISWLPAASIGLHYQTVIEMALFSDDGGIKGL
jgi:hypothetical protein